MILSFWVIWFPLVIATVGLLVAHWVVPVARRDAKRRFLAAQSSGRIMHLASEPRYFRHITDDPGPYDEAELLGPVSAWVAEGEARAVRDWEVQWGDPWSKAHDLLNRPQPPEPGILTQPDCDGCDWEELCVVEQLEPVAYVRMRRCDRHQVEPPADISGFKMVEIR